MFNQDIVNDHLNSVATCNAEERRMQEELDALRNENLAMRETIRSTVEKTTGKKNKAEQDHIANTTEYMSKFRD